MDLNDRCAGAAARRSATRDEAISRTASQLPRPSDRDRGSTMTKRFMLALAVALLAPSARAEIPAEQDSCLGCHGSDPSMSMDLPSGEKLPLYVDQATFAKSVHGDMLRCTDCHTDKADYPHESKPFKTRRDVTVAYYEQCKKCHFSNYTKTLDGVHFQLAAEGQPAGRALRRLPRLPRHRPPGRAAHPRLRDLLELPQEGLRGLQRQRPRQGRHPGQPRRAGLHRLPPRPRRGRPARRRPLAAHRRDLRPLPHRPEADEALRPLHQRGRDLPGRLPRHGGVAAEGQEGQGRSAGGRLHRLPRRPRHPAPQRPQVLGDAGATWSRPAASATRAPPPTSPRPGCPTTSPA